MKQLIIFRLKFVYALWGFFSCVAVLYMLPVFFNNSIIRYSSKWATLLLLAVYAASFAVYAIYGLSKIVIWEWKNTQFVKKIKESQDLWILTSGRISNIEVCEKTYRWAIKSYEIIYDIQIQMPSGKTKKEEISISLEPNKFPRDIAFKNEKKMIPFIEKQLQYKKWDMIRVHIDPEDHQNIYIPEDQRDIKIDSKIYPHYDSIYTLLLYRWAWVLVILLLIPAIWILLSR